MYFDWAFLQKSKISTQKVAMQSIVSLWIFSFPQKIHPLSWNVHPLHAHIAQNRNTGIHVRKVQDKAEQDICNHMRVVTWVHRSSLSTEQLLFLPTESLIIVRGSMVMDSRPFTLLSPTIMWARWEVKARWTWFPSQPRYFLVMWKLWVRYLLCPVRPAEVSHRKS